jgi:hypothetical protein
MENCFCQGGVPNARIRFDDSATAVGLILRAVWAATSRDSVETASSANRPAIVHSQGTLTDGVRRLRYGLRGTFAAERASLRGF